MAIPGTPQAPGGNLDRAISKTDRWFSENFGLVHTPVPSEDLVDFIEAGHERCGGCGNYCTAGGYDESGAVGCLRRELGNIRQALISLHDLGAELHRFAGLRDYQAGLEEIRAGLAAVTDAAGQLTTRASERSTFHRA